jgi:protein FRA10AC1
LHSYELNFAYKEHGQQKQELVKVRVCSHCAGKLNYRRQHKRSSRNEESSSRSSSKKRKHRERNDGDKTSDESEEKAIRSEPSATASSEITGNERGIEESLVSEGEEGKASTTSGAEGAAEASSWAGEAPTAKCEGDEMDAYLSGLFL